MLKLKSALISVFNKDGLEPIAKKLDKLGVKIYSTGGTELFLKKIGIPVIKVEDVTGYPSILGGRVKTLHPKIFGGILNRNDNNNDISDLKSYEIPNIDLVIVDLYPFEETVKSNQSEENIIEKIDIGGISLIRAAAKNFKDVMCVSSKDDYSDFLNILNNDKGEINLKYRKNFAFRAFNVSSHYDTADAGRVGPHTISEMDTRGSLCLVSPDGNGTFLTPRPDTFNGVRDMDSARLEHALRNTDHSVTYQHGVTEVVSKLVAGVAASAILIRPVSLAEIRRTADTGELMPPKSTFFTPKLRTGMVMRDLN